MRSLYSISLYTALGFRAVTAMTYIIDSSCGFSLDPILAETSKMAATANDKLGKGDEVMVAALKQIFQTTDASFITTGFNAIKDMSPTSDRAQADVRFYCDNDDWDSNPGGTSKRWQLQPDVKLSKKDKKKGLKVNSERDFALQRYWDPVNELVKPTGSKGCQDPDPDDGTLTTLAQTYRVAEGAEIESNQNHYRAVIVICKLAMDEKLKVLSDVSVESDLSKDNLQMIDMEDLVSVTLFHEFCHMVQVFNCEGARKGSEEEQEKVGWDDIIGLPTVKAKKQADAYALLGLAAALSDRNARLSTDPDKSREGVIQWIEPPKKPTRKRGSPHWFSS